MTQKDKTPLKIVLIFQNLGNLPIHDDYFGMSLDVQSLFTEVSLNPVFNGLKQKILSLSNCKTVQKNIKMMI